jgi:hypothetical protein
MISRIIHISTLFAAPITATRTNQKLSTEPGHVHPADLRYLESSGISPSTCSPSPE